MSYATDTTAPTLYLDFDGTIVDPAPRLYQLYSEAMARLGRQPLPKARYWALKRRRQSELAIMRRSAPVDDLTPYLTTRVSQIEHPSLLQHDEVLPRVREALDRLAGAYRLVLVSRRRQERALIEQVADLGLTGYFARVTACYEPGVPGWAAKAAAVRTDRPGSRTRAVVIGDTEDDIGAGQALGLETVAVLTGLRTRGWLAALRPSAVVRSLAQLPAWLHTSAGSSAPPTGSA